MANEFYMSVSFSYLGPFDGCCEDPEANKALSEASKLARAALGRVVQFVHEYSWPDGSLSYYIRGIGDRYEIRRKIEGELVGTQIFVHDDSRVLDGSYNPRKAYHKTLSGLFRAKYGNKKWTNPKALPGQEGW